VPDLPIEDYVAIQRLYSRYSWAADRREMEAWLASWTADGVMVHPDGTTYTGREELEAQARAHMVEGAYHWTGNLDVEATETGARGRCYLLYVVTPDGAPRIEFALHYEDELVKQDGRWLFKRRVVRSG
jgi:uncharacterized protein (TIGR02246 family)